MAEMETPVPGPVHVVDHALSRAGRRGAMATIDVDGEPNPEVYRGDEPEAAENDAARFDGWLDNVGNFDGVIDETIRDDVAVDVGVEANGGGFGFGPAAVEVSPGTEVNWQWTARAGTTTSSTRAERSRAAPRTRRGSRSHTPSGSPASTSTSVARTSPSA